MKSWDAQSCEVATLKVQVVRYPSAGNAPLWSRFEISENQASCQCRDLASLSHQRASTSPSSSQRLKNSSNESCLLSPGAQYHRTSNLRARALARDYNRQQLIDDTNQTDRARDGVAPAQQRRKWSRQSLLNRPAAQRGLALTYLRLWSRKQRANRHLKRY